MKFDDTILLQAKKTAQGGDLVPLDSLSAPLVGELQNQIRAQYNLILQMDRAIEYALEKTADSRACTEMEERLVTALANARSRPRKAIAREFRAHHDPEYEYGCYDEGGSKEAA